MSTKYMVTVENNGFKFWLRSTTWAFDIERGDKFDTKTQAEAAWERAKKFAAAAIRKKIVIETFEED